MGNPRRLPGGKLRARATRLHCLRCGYRWEPSTNRLPQKCPNPNCRRANWNEKMTPERQAAFDRHGAATKAGQARGAAKALEPRDDAAESKADLDEQRPAAGIVAKTDGF